MFFCWMDKSWTGTKQFNLIKLPICLINLFISRQCPAPIFAEIRPNFNEEICQWKTFVFYLHMMTLMKVASGSLWGECEPTKFTILCFSFIKKSFLNRVVLRNTTLQKHREGNKSSFCSVTLSGPKWRYERPVSTSAGDQATSAQ